MNKILTKQRRVVELTEAAIQATVEELETLRAQATKNPDLRTLVAKYDARLERQRNRLSLAKKELAALEILKK